MMKQGIKQGDEVTVKLDNATIEHSKAVNSSVLGKFNLWHKENDNDKYDSTVCLIRDQMIMERVYINLAEKKKKQDLTIVSWSHLKDTQQALDVATVDSDLHHSASKRSRALGQLLLKAKDKLYDCNLNTGTLRAMIQTADENVRGMRKQSIFLSQLVAKTISNGIHCLSMRLTIFYYLLPPEKMKFPRSENLENPKLYHYDLFSDNVLAAPVVVNSAIMNAKVLFYFHMYIIDSCPPLFRWC